MTSNEAGDQDEPVAGRGSRARLDAVAHPLSEYIRGTLRVYFQGGAVVSRDAAQADARAFLEMLKDDRTSDDVAWDSLRWFQWDREQVVFSSFDAFRDQNWEISPEHRRLLQEAGHPRGVVASLVEYWQKQDRRSEPLYSVAAIAALHNFALDEADHALWESAAKTFEGQSGAALLAQVAGGPASQTRKALADLDAERRVEDTEGEAEDVVDEQSVAVEADDDAEPEDGPYDGATAPDSQDEGDAATEDSAELPSRDEG